MASSAGYPYGEAPVSDVLWDDGNLRIVDPGNHRDSWRHLDVIAYDSTSLSPEEAQELAKKLSEWADQQLGRE